MRERMEPETDVRLQRPAATATEALPADESPCFRIDHMSLAGDAAERFQWALAAASLPADAATGRCLGSHGINIVMARVQNALVQKGYVTTRVLAAPQDLKSGTLTLTVLPGRIRAIRFTEDSNPRATPWNALPARPGDILNLRDIEQGLENFKRVPTAEADIQIVPAGDAGARPGESDLVIRWHQGIPFRISATVDDSGSSQTGKYLGSVTLSFDDWWTLNDLFYASLNHDLGGGDPGARGTRGTSIESVPNSNDDTANRDFRALNPQGVRTEITKRGPVKIGTLDDGSKVILRPSKDGRTTIEFQNGRGRTKREIRYGKK